MTKQEYLDCLLAEVIKQTNLKWKVEEFTLPKNLFWRVLSFVYREDSTPRYVLSCEWYDDLVEDPSDQDADLKEINDRDAVLYLIDFSDMDPKDVEYNAKYHVPYEVVVAYLRGVLHGIKTEASTIVYVEYKK